MILIIFVLVIVIHLISFHYYKNKQKECSRRLGHKTIIAFFHPHCASFGGGERVLWKAIQAIGELCREGLNIAVVVYTSDVYSSSYKEDVLLKVKDRFSIDVLDLPLKLTFVHIPPKRDPSTFQRCSLVAEALDTIKLAWYAVNACTPHIFIDSTGCTFTFIVAKLVAHCKVVAYVHYPTISTDMLSLVWERRPNFNNTTNISRSRTFTYLKLIYYLLFALAYGCIGSLADLVLVNSTWTYNHIHKIWRLARNRIHIVYPPCDTRSLTSNDIHNRQRLILSIGQFRPEKDHMLQIRSFATFLHDSRYKIQNRDVKLVLLGSCRGKSDEQIVSNLQKLADSLGVSNSVEFVLNQPFSVLKEYFAKASIGLHTMWNEHFGIGVVEMMAAGLITIAHNSGGPKTDIIHVEDTEKEGRTGYLAYSEEEYSNTMNTILNELSSEKCLAIREYAQKSSQRFSDDVFNSSFKSQILKLI